MSDLSYWEKRKAQNMFEYMEDAEKAADEISKVYMKASSYLSVEAEKIFQKFRSKHNLSEAEARTLINSLIDPTSMEELKRRLAEAPDDSEQAQILAEIESQAYRDRIERMEGMQDQIDSVMQNVYQQEKHISTEHYINLGKESYYRSIYDIQHKTGYAFGFSKVDDNLIRQVINSKWSGQNYSNRIWKNTKELSQDIKKELLVNLLTGRTEREAAEVIANKCSVGSFQARRLVRTESSFLSSQMDMKSYEECEIDYYFFMATLDLRTSEKCRNLDGKRFKVKDQQPGLNCPPMHPFCRSTTGCDITPEDLANMKRRARNPKTGKTELVPGDMTYQQWYEKYVSGDAEAELNEKIEKNRSSDRKQFDKYKGIIGKDLPDSLVDFQKIKYNDSEKWSFIKLDYKRKKHLIDHPEFKLPNAEHATADDNKFKNYLFGGENPKGLAKGNVFESRLGFNKSNWEELRQEILSRAPKYPVIHKGNSGHGNRYEQQIVVYGKKEKPANVLVAWSDDTFPGQIKMVSAYITEVK